MVNFDVICAYEAEALEFSFDMNLHLLNVCFLTVYYHDKINNIYNNIFILISGIFAFAFAFSFALRKK